MARSDTHKWVYSFGDGTAEGRADMRDLLGGKGANLAEMCRLGLPVPPGFTITTEVCTWFFNNADNAKQRANRLRLLSQIRTIMGKVADFSQIEG